MQVWGDGDHSSRAGRDYPDLKPLPWNVWAAMVMAAVPCIVYGVWPGLLALQAPFEATFGAYTLHNIIKTVELLLMTGLGFMLLVKVAAPKPGFALDLDWFVRWPLAFAGLALSRGFVRFQEAVGAGAARLVTVGHVLIQNPLMLAERMLGRGMAGKAGGSGELEARLEDGDTYRLPLGPTIAVVLVVFGIAPVVQLVVTATAG